MPIPIRFREALYGVSGYLVESLDGMSASLEGYLDAEHNADGTHKDLTADTIKIAGQSVPITTIYTPTLADVVNTTTETTFLSFVVEAGKMMDGDRIEIDVFATFQNDQGGGQTCGVDVAWGSVEGDLAGYFFDSNAGDEYTFTRFTLVRSGNTLWGGVGYAGSFGSFNANLASSVALFAERQLVQLKMTMTAASATFYYKPQVAKIVHTSGLSA